MYCVQLNPITVCCIRPGQMKVESLYIVSTLDPQIPIIGTLISHCPPIIHSLIDKIDYPFISNSLWFFGCPDGYTRASQCPPQTPKAQVTFQNRSQKIYSNNI